MFEVIGLVLLNKGKALAGFAIFFLIVESRFPSKKNKKIMRPGLGLDLTYSFLLVLLFIPVQTYLSPIVGKYFFGAIGMSAEQLTGRVKITFLEKPKYGQASVLPDGRIQYAATTNITGMDTFSIERSDGENYLTQTLLAKLEMPENEYGVLTQKNLKPNVSLFITSKTQRGPVTEGLSGVALNIRNQILELSIWVQIFIAVFVIDFVGYWRHRLMHTRFLWPFHAIHHSSKQVDWLSTERFHPINYYISAILNLIILAAFFQNAYVGATAMLLRRGYGLFIHSNIPIGYGFLDYIFVSPRFHKWHHSDSKVAEKKNYATIFSFIDFAFNSFYLPKDKKDPETFGFYGGELGNGFFEQLIYPFRKQPSSPKALQGGES